MTAALVASWYKAPQWLVYLRLHTPHTVAMKLEWAVQALAKHILRLHTVTMKLEWAVQSLAPVLYQYS